MQVAKVGPDNKAILQPIRIGTDFGTEVEIAAASSRVTASSTIRRTSLQAGDVVRVAQPSSG